MEITSFTYDLDPEEIAQFPATPRDSARLLVDYDPNEYTNLGKNDCCQSFFTDITKDISDEERVVHCNISDVIHFLNEGDVVVINTTKVIPARLHLQRDNGGKAEVLMLQKFDDGWWEALAKPSKKLHQNMYVPLVKTDCEQDASGSEKIVDVNQKEIGLLFGEDLGQGKRRVKIVSCINDPNKVPHGQTSRDLELTYEEELEIFDVYGEMPLPPYITEVLCDQERYQTIYAKNPGSSAAPTAGLHFTEEVLQRCREHGVQIVEVELFVGLGTFRPITVQRIEDHTMHAEIYHVPESTWEICATAKKNGNQVIAIGTTSLRALESAAASGELTGQTSLFIYAPYDFKIVDRLLTNFHLPASSLLVLIDAFIGSRWRDLYAIAKKNNYRFLSFGDAMLLTKINRFESIE